MATPPHPGGGRGHGWVAVVAGQISETMLEVIFKCFQAGLIIKGSNLNIHLAAYVCLIHLVAPQPEQ